NAARLSARLHARGESNLQPNASSESALPISISSLVHEDIVLRDPSIASDQPRPSKTKQSARSMEVTSLQSILTAEPASTQLLLRKPVAVKSPERTHITEPSRETPQAPSADMQPTQRNPVPAPHRASTPSAASHRLDTIQFDALVERLVARLELEARRQGRFR